MSSTYSVSYAVCQCVFGLQTGACPHSTFCHSRNDGNPWLQIDLGEPTFISHVVVVNRINCCQDRIVGYSIGLFAGPDGTMPIGASQTFATTNATYTFLFPLNCAGASPMFAAPTPMTLDPTTVAPTSLPTSPPSLPPSSSPAFTPTGYPTTLTPTTPTTAGNTTSPTANPTCSAGNHGCDMISTYCAQTPASPFYVCACRQGYIPVAGSSNRCAPTPSPTLARPTVSTVFPSTVSEEPTGASSSPTEASSGSSTGAPTNSPTGAPSIAPTGIAVSGGHSGDGGGSFVVPAVATVLVVALVGLFAGFRFFMKKKSHPGYVKPCIKR